MTHVTGPPDEFAADAVAGFTDIYADLVRAVPGGVVRAGAGKAGAGKEGKVALVIGGGSGHYPAFAGYVGTGLADAAVLGDVFASPPTRHIVEVARQVAGPAGVLLGYGNYTGDVLNFTAAAKTLEAEGIPARMIAVTDDVASSPRGDEGSRRGIAGDVVVFKVAAAAAEAGYDLDGVCRVAAAANGRTRSFGVAFGGCTLPGHEEPLFGLAAGEMGVGLGIHGEPGITTEPVPPAPVLAGLLVSTLLGEAPGTAGSDVAVLLNGLGATKYEELFVLWRFVAPLLRSAGLRLIGPEVGELVTSLDMAGCSLTVTWLNDELTSLWLAPAHAPAFRRGTTDKATIPQADPVVAPVAGRSAAWPESSAESRRSAQCVVEMLRAALAEMTAMERELGRLDALAGDGDHGQAMVRGLTAALAAAEAAAAGGAGAGSTLGAGAVAWTDRAGGTSGALWGVALTAWGAVLGDTQRPTAQSVAEGAQAALRAVMDAGGAKAGDKTIVDAFAPFAAELVRAANGGQELSAGWDAAVGSAASAAESTSALSPRLGRARLLPARSAGHPDAGAVSFAACVRAAAGQIAPEAAR